PVAAGRGADQADALRIEVLARANPVEDRIPHTLGIERSLEGRLPGAGHVDRQHPVALFEEDLGAALLLVRIDSAPRHDHGRPLGATRAPEVRDDRVALAGPPAEGD